MSPRVMTREELRRFTPGGIRPLEYVPFPVETLPEPCQSFVSQAAIAIGCDPSFVALPMLAGLATAIGTTRRIRLKDSWTEPSVMWCANVGESGSQKSPALDLAVAPLRHAQDQALREHSAAMCRYKHDMEVYEADFSAWRRRGGGRSKGEPAPKPPEEPRAVRYVVTDITVEALANVLNDNPRGVLSVNDELSGWFSRHDQYRSGRGGDVAHYLAMHRAGSLLVDRKNNVRGAISVEHAAVSICGGIQPEVFERALGRVHVENGMLARFLVAMPPRTLRRWSEKTVDPQVSRAMDSVYQQLLSLDWAVNAEGQRKPIDIPLTPSGRHAWIDWFEKHAAEGRELGGASSAMWSKLEGYSARLALLVHHVRLASGDPTLESPDAIDALSMRAGATLADWFGHEARRINEARNESAEERQEQELLDFIGKRGGSLTSRELQQSKRAYNSSAEAAEAALDRLTKKGLAHWEPSPAGKAGHPTRRCIVNTEE